MTYTTLVHLGSVPQIKFARGQKSSLGPPQPPHLEMWNKRVQMDPIVIQTYFQQCVDTMRFPFKVQTRIIFSAPPTGGNPSIIFEIWPIWAEIPDIGTANRAQRIARATFILEKNQAYFDWMNVTRDFVRNGKTFNWRGQGIGTDLLATVFPLFVAMGYERVGVSAQSHGQNRGAYIWPRLGMMVCDKSSGIRKGLDELPSILAKKFNEMREGLKLPSSVAGGIIACISMRKPWMLIDLTGVRYEVPDPEGGGDTQISELLLRGEYIEGYFPINEETWWAKVFGPRCDRDYRGRLKEVIQECK